MSAIEAALTELIDYAGLYPPAGLDMRTAVSNYLAYREQKHAWILGRFIVDLGRLDELRDAAGDALAEMRLSVIAAADSNLEAIARYRDYGFRVESAEIQCAEPLKIARICERLPPPPECFIEIPVRAGYTGAIDAVASARARAKLRMGGVVPEAFPTAKDVADRLHVLADRKVAFKATAGLHHPLRSQHRLTYSPDSRTGTMHGFMNVLCAAAVTHFGGTAEEAADLLEEESAGAFQVGADSIAAHGHRWTTAQLREMRQCFTSFGSCSFTEPIHDLEALGWPIERT
jgi:hypothetical protein